MQNESKRTYDKKRKGQRGENWTCIVYPDSAPEKWQKKLEMLQVKAAISPLHDRDLWTEDDEADNPDHVAGTPKKAHWHVLLVYTSVKTSAQVEEDVAAFGGVSLQKVSDRAAMARYLCHMDNPDKCKYNTADVVTFGGLDYQALIITNDCKYSAIAEMTKWCRTNCIYSFAVLMEYAREHEPVWFRSLCDNAGWVMLQYVKSLEYEMAAGLSGYTVTEAEDDGTAEGGNEDGADWTEDGPDDAGSAERVCDGDGSGQDCGIALSVRDVYTAEVLADRPEDRRQVLSREPDRAPHHGEPAPNSAGPTGADGFGLERGQRGIGCCVDAGTRKIE